MDISKKRVLTGIKPTGMAHLGNLLGAIRPILDMSHEAAETVIFIADLHALNTIRDPEQLKQYTREIAATFLALGLNTEKCIFFRQSDIPELYILNSLLLNVTPKGLMNRAHAYKDKVQKNIDEGRDADDGVNMGLFTYPGLMAADILLYDGDLIPVGQDQKQHIEIARDIAGAFNALYAKEEPILRVPTPIIPETVSAIPGLDGRKMSKSYDNTIGIFEPAGPLKKKVMRIVTDSREPEEAKDPLEIPIYSLYAAFAPEAKAKEMHDGFAKGGLRYGDAKKMLAEALEAALAEPRARYEALLESKTLDLALEEGADKARAYANPKLMQVRRAMLGE